MFYGSEINDTRKFFVESWNKYLTKTHLTDLEQQIVDVILQHPEYHAIFEHEAALDLSYFGVLGEENPFLHLGLHLAIRDQIKLDQPKGIREIYLSLLIKHQNELETEHIMMECLAEFLWNVQHTQQLPDQNEYLRLCKNLLKS